MNIKNIFIYSGITVLLAMIVLTILANRDLKRIYGGLTEQVNLSQFDTATTPVVITNATILAPEGDRFLSWQTITIENGLITSLSSREDTPPEYSVIDAQGKFIIPGLVDAHVHLFKSPNDLLLYVANGVTQVRELIGEDDHLRWRKNVQKNGIGPDMFIASPRVGSFGFMQGKFMEWSQGYINLTNAKEAETAVKKFHEQGYDAVKIYSQINRETYEAVASTASELGMKVVGHVPWELELSDLYGRQDGIGHLEEIMNAFDREFGEFGYDSTDEFLSYVEIRSYEVAAELLKHDLAITTTLWLVESFVEQKTDLDKVLKEIELEYENPGISEWSTTSPRGIGWLPEVNRYKWPDEWDQERREKSRNYWETYAKACAVIVKILSDKGVRIMTGTDANLPPTVPGFSLHREFASLEKAGMSAAQILRSATSVPAAWLDNNAGEISVGKKANLVLLDRDPLLDISHTKLINSVILNGRVLDRTVLDRMLAAVKEANDNSRREDISHYSHSH